MVFTFSKIVFSVMYNVKREYDSPLYPLTIRNAEQRNMQSICKSNHKDNMQYQIINLI